MRGHIATGIALRAVAGAVLIAAAALAAFVGAPAAEPARQAASAQPLTVIATWTGTEGADFQAVLERFEKNTGIHVDYIGTRALDQLLASDVQQGNPPALAILSSPATLLQYQRQGYLYPLGPVIGKQQISAYDRQWLHIMTLGTGKVYTLPVKTEVHNLVWYDPQHWPAGRPAAESAPPTWSQLIALDSLITAHGGTPWCVGLDSTPVSGWPAADWIGDILLHQAGTTAYQKWANGELSWTSSQVIAAWRAWGSLVAGPRQVYGGGMAALVTGWDAAGKPLFTASPGCYLQHAPSFITLNYQLYGSRPGTGYDFFPFPMAGLPGETPGAANGAWEVSADLLAMFSDTPDAEDLVRYLASKQAQMIWPGIPGGGATSARLDVPLTTYPDPVGKAIAGTVTDPHATLCFNASDEMPDTLLNAFYQGVMEYLRNRGQLLAILGRLNQVQQATYSVFPGGHPDFSCGLP
jgi:alpha-glucoside transport system substrate-binding protein